MNLDYQDTHINLIDTPGFPDFIGQAIAVLPAVETVAVVINAQTGIEAVTQRMMERAAARRLCRMIVVNKIDAENVDLPGLLDQIQETFGRECLPINLPAKQGATVVDCFFNPSGDSDFSSVAAAHSALIDQVVEVDEDLMTLYLEQGEDLQPEQLHEPFREGAARRPSDSDLLRFGPHRRRPGGSAGHVHATAAQSDRRQPRTTDQG